MMKGTDMQTEDLRRELTAGAAALIDVVDMMQHCMSTDEIEHLAEETIRAASAADDPFALPALHASAARHFVRAILSGEGVNEAIDTAVEAAQMGAEGKVH